MSVLSTGRVERARADIRLALRALRRRPVFATTAMLTVAIGIAASVDVVAAGRSLARTGLGFEDIAPALRAGRVDPASELRQ